ncbi:MAG: hypothetical protein AAF609_14995 [Cyanobacteria bacterium P01_C01_bin.120]
MNIEKAQSMDLVATVMAVGQAMIVKDIRTISLTIATGNKRIRVIIDEDHVANLSDSFNRK